MDRFSAGKHSEMSALGQIFEASSAKGREVLLVGVVLAICVYPAPRIFCQVLGMERVLEVAFEAVLVWS